MAKTKLRDEPMCENCSICTKVAEVQEYNDVSKLLDTIDPNDSNAKIISQYRLIINYECLVCFFKTNRLNDWKCHIMSTYHLADCHKISDLYSDVCTVKTCKILLYGPLELLIKHKRSHMKSFRANCNMAGVPLLMFTVMKRYVAKLESETLHYCSHCKKFAEKPIHDNESKIKNPVNYYCKFCNVYFFSSSEMVDFHFLTVEHMTLKFLFEFNTEARTNSKKIKLSEESDEKKDQIMVYQESITEPKLQVPNLSTLKLPFILLTRFNIITQNSGQCKLCDMKTKLKRRAVIKHILIQCKYKHSFSDLMITDLKNLAKTFACDACKYFSANILEYKDHIISNLHITKSLHSVLYYSYFCSECKIFMYSLKITIINHLQLHGVGPTRFPLLFMSMKNIFKVLITNPNRVEIVHYYGDNSTAISNFSRQCFSCQIQFHTTITDYLIHKLTSEHIILKMLNLTPQNEENHNMLETIETQILKHNDPLIQNVTSIKVDNNENAQNNPANKTLVGINEVQKSNTNNDLDQSNEQAEHSRTKLNNHIQLKSSGSKQCEQYKKYFKYKMELLNILRKYRDDVVNTSAYYCEMCDFLYEDKSIWEKHIDDKHAASGSTRLTFFCPTCSLLIFGNNAHEHNGTVEHSVLLKILQSLKPLEEGLIKKTLIMEPNYNCSYEDLEKEKKTVSNINRENTDDAKEMQVNHYSENYVANNNDLNRFIENIPNTLLLQDKLDHQIEDEIDKTTVSDAVKHNGIIPISSNPPNTLSTMLRLGNEDVKKQTFFNCVNVSNAASLLCPVGINFSKKIVEPQKISLVSGETICSLDLPSTTMSNPITLKTDKFNNDFLLKDFKPLGRDSSENTSIKQNIKSEVFTQDETEVILKEFGKALRNKIVSNSVETTESLTSVSKLSKSQIIDENPQN